MLPSKDAGQRTAPSLGVCLALRLQMKDLSCWSFHVIVQPLTVVPPSDLLGPDSPGDEDYRKRVGSVVVPVPSPVLPTHWSEILAE